MKIIARSSLSIILFVLFVLFVASGCPQRSFGQGGDTQKSVVQPSADVVPDAQARKAENADPLDNLISLEIKDLTPKFLKFYEAAVAEKADPERRWALWQQHYGFAAVPPTTQGDAMARKMLDEAWLNYPKVMDSIHAGAAGMKPKSMPILKEVARLLNLTRPIKVKLVVYVGMMEGNAFSVGQDGVQIVYIPVEMSPERRELILIHELTHAVHIAAAGLSGGWTRTIAETMLQEGLAVRTTQALRPGHKTAEYIEFTPGWLAECEKHRKEILAGIQPNLADSSSETVFKFTMGKGASGLEREAYFAGWLAVENMVKHGMTLAQIAHIPEAKIMASVEKVVERLQAESGRPAD